MKKMVANNLETRSFFNKKLLEYKDRLGLSEQPLLLFDDEIKLVGVEAKEYAKKADKFLGLSWYKGQLDNLDQAVIWIHLNNSDFIWQMVDILIHELCHLRWPDLEEDEIQDVVNKVIVGRRY